MTLSLGIDIGTSGIRTAVIDNTGNPISMAQADHLPQHPEHIDAELWWTAVQTCIHTQVKNLKQSNIDPDQINRIAVDGTSGTMVLTDVHLKPVTRALMYNSKGFEAESARIAQFAPSSHITQGSASALGRAMRLVSEDINKDARYLLHQADFIAAKLMDRGGLSDHNNALKTGFDPEAQSWPHWFEHLIDPTLLPDPKSIGSPLDSISNHVASTLGLSQNTVICAGTTDSIAAFFAAAPMEVGVAVTSLGSTLAIKMLSKTRIDDPSIGLYSHRIGDVWLVGGASNTGGAVLAHFFNSSDLKRLSALIDPKTYTGLDYYPLLCAGERFPINDPHLEPRLTPRPKVDTIFLQGLFEGIAEIEAKCYHAMQKRGAEFPTVIYSAGGGASNSVFTDIRAKAIGLRPILAKQSEAAVGVARIASA